VYLISSFFCNLLIGLFLTVDYSYTTATYFYFVFATSAGVESGPSPLLGVSPIAAAFYSRINLFYSFTLSI